METIKWQSLSGVWVLPRRPTSACSIHSLFSVLCQFLQFIYVVILQENKLSLGYFIRGCHLRFQLLMRLFYNFSVKLLTQRFGPLKVYSVIKSSSNMYLSKSGISNLILLKLYLMRKRLKLSQRICLEKYTLTS